MPAWEDETHAGGEPNYRHSMYNILADEIIKDQNNNFGKNTKQDELYTHPDKWLKTLCPKVIKQLEKGISQDYCFRCGSASCIDQECRDLWARQATKKLYLLPPIDYYITIKFLHFQRPHHDVFKECWKKFKKALTYQCNKHNKTITIKHFPDFTKDDVDHNLLLWTTGFETWQEAKAFIRPLWASCFDEPFYFYLRPPNTQEGCGKYATGNTSKKNKRHYPPPDWLGQRLVL